MTRGAILFAHNSPKYDYYAMAVVAAKRINYFLGLPVTIVTDEESIDLTSTYKFDKTIITTPDKSNKRDWGIWINKGRYQAYEFSPYDETLLLDVDYVVNSDKLLKTFDLSKDFCCHNKTEYFMNPDMVQETLGPFSFDTLWATVIMFKKTKKSKQIFECLEMVQKNFNHYANIHRFISEPFRNDYALTIALRLVNGHIVPEDNIIPWSLMHVGKNTHVHKNSYTFFNTVYTVTENINRKEKLRKEYITIKNMDFHLINKDDFLKTISPEYSVLDVLNVKKLVGNHPLFWVVKGNNIIISRGKIGTSTLRTISDYHSGNTLLTGDKLLEMVKNEGYNLNFVIRDPRERFRAGILEDWSVMINYEFTDATLPNINAFVTSRLAETHENLPRGQYHIGNWLEDVVNISSQFEKDQYTIWDIKDLSTLLRNLGVDETHINPTENKPDICLRFLEEYDNSLTNFTIENIEQYLADEVQLYEQLVNIGKSV